MQLVAYGAQDVYLTGNPEVTFFQAKYKRHTNFAMENIEQTVNGTAANSGRVSVTVARNGDLVGDMYIELESDKDVTTTTAAGDCNWVAERAVNNVELSIGGQRIDKHYQKWWRMYSELYLDESKKATWGKMTTAKDGKTVYLPLIFFFNRNPGLALPLIALQYHEVRIDFDLASNFTTYLNTQSVFKVWANYVYLDTEERRRFAQKGHEYLIEQVQHTGTDTVTADGGTKQVRLSYNHPVKELVWCFSNTQTNNSLWNFTTASTDRNIRLESDQLLVAHHNNGSNCFVNTASSGVPMLMVGKGEATQTQFTEEAGRSPRHLQAHPQRSGPFQGAEGQVLQPGPVLQPPHRLPLPRYLLVLFRAQARGAPAYRHLQLLQDRQRAGPGCHRGYHQQRDLHAHVRH